MRSSPGRLALTSVTALLLAGASTSAVAQSFSGPATITQPTTANHCVKIGPNGGNNIVDAGANCGSGSGTVTSVSGTVNQVSVATGTTTPVLSIPSTFIAPGSIEATSTIKADTSLTVGAGSAITSSGPGGALGSNAFSSTTYCPLAGCTFTGTIQAAGWSQTAAGVETAASMALGSAAIGSNALAVTGMASVDGLNVTGSTIPANGLYLAAANDIAISTNSLKRIDFSTTAVNFNAPLVLGGNSITGAGLITSNNQISTSLSPAVSGSALSLSGAPQTGGTGTTNFPLAYFNTSGAAAVTSFSTAGTYLGVNAASGFAGNFLDFHVNGGPSVAFLQSNGTFAANAIATQNGGNVTGSAIIAAAANIGIQDTSYSQTAASAFSMVNLSGTLNTSGSPDVFKLAITNTASGGTTRLLNLYAGGAGTTSVFSVDPGGNVAALGNVISSSTVQAASGGAFNWAGSRGILTSPATGSIQLGSTDGASPVAQILRAQSGSGTNIAGVSTTIIGSLATGSASSGDIIFQTGGAVAGSGTTAATATTALTIKGVTNLIQLGSPSTIANATAAVTNTSLGPVGTTCVIGNWFKIKDSAANDRYIPMYSCT